MRKRTAQEIATNKHRGRPVFFHASIIVNALISLMAVNAIAADVQVSEAEMFKRFVTTPPIIAEMILEESYPMSLSNSAPTYYRLAFQEGAMFLRKGKSLEAVKQPMEKGNSTVQGVYGSNYWEIEPVSDSMVSVREYQGDGTDIVPTLQQAKRNVESASAALRNFLRLGLLAPGPRPLEWQGDGYASKDETYGVQTTGRVEVVNGQVFHARGALIMRDGKPRTYRTDYMYAPTKTPNGIPIGITNVMERAGKPDFISFVLRIVELRTAASPQDFSEFEPGRHLGRVNVLFLREVDGRVEYADPKGKWLKAGAGAIQSDKSSPWRAIYVILAVSILGLAAIVGYKIKHTTQSNKRTS